VSVGTAPSALAVDGAVNTVYVANLGSNTVSTLKRSACSTLKAACKKRGHTLTLGASADPAAVLVDRSTRTLYVADSGTNAVAFVNTSTCNIGVHKACGRTPHVRHGFAGADGIALTASGGLAVASAAGDAVVAFRSSTCNAHSRRGCSTSVHPLAGSPAGIASNGMSVYVSDVTNSSVDIVHIGKG
jgi:DNA-binding beta-propeller fold protein YncE